MTEKREKWEDEFDKRFIVRCSNGDILKDIDPKKVKSFIRNLISKEYVRRETEVDLMGHQYALEVLVSNLGLPEGSNYSDILKHIQSNYVRRNGVGIDKGRRFQSSKDVLTFGEGER